MKWVGYILLVALVGAAWMMYSSSGKELAEIDRQLAALERSDDTEEYEEQLPKLESKKTGIEGQKTFNGILLTFLSAGLVGVLFVFQVLPALAHRFTHAVYDSAEMVEKDSMHDARSLVAQGDYEGAIVAFKLAAAADPLNRLPWVEIAKIQKDNLEQPLAAIQTIRQALEGQEWQINDAAYFLFRLAELYDEYMTDRVSAASILQQVVEQFPETRHSANARHKLHEWGLA